jgi:hypothetical protein
MFTVQVALSANVPEFTVGVLTIVSDTSAGPLPSRYKMRPGREKRVAGGYIKWWIENG